MATQGFAGMLDGSWGYDVIKTPLPKRSVTSELTLHLGVNFLFDYQNARVRLETADYLLKYSKRFKWDNKSVPGYDLNLEECGKGITIFYNFPEAEPVTLKLDDTLFKGEVDPRMYFPQPAKSGERVIISGTNEVLTVGKSASGENEWQSIGYNYRPFVIGEGKQELICIQSRSLCIPHTSVYLHRRCSP